MDCTVSCCIAYSFYFPRIFLILSTEIFFRLVRRSTRAETDLERRVAGWNTIYQAVSMLDGPAAAGCISFMRKVQAQTANTFARWHVTMPPWHPPPGTRGVVGRGPRARGSTGREGAQPRQSLPISRLPISISISCQFREGKWTGMRRALLSRVLGHCNGATVLRVQGPRLRAPSHWAGKGGPLAPGWELRGGM